jgi:alpha-tubulin suppressor-like RCC1 family protein
LIIFDFKQIPKIKINIKININCRQGRTLRSRRLGGGPLLPGPVTDFAWGDGPGEVEVVAPSLVAVAAGDWHSAAVAADGRLFCWGNNSGAHTTTTPLAHVLSHLIAVCVVCVVCGVCHVWCVLCCADGECVSGGPKVLQPRLVGGDLKDRVFVDVACAGHFTLALTQNGEVVVWGKINDRVPHRTHRTHRTH